MRKVCKGFGGTYYEKNNRFGIQPYICFHTGSSASDGLADAACMGNDQSCHTGNLAGREPEPDFCTLDCK